MSKIRCPKCESVIPSDSINVSENLAFCVPCGEGFSLSKLAGVEDDLKSRLTARAAAMDDLDVSDTLDGVDVASPPWGCSRRVEVDGVRLSVSTRSVGSFLFFTFFCAIWCGVTGVFVVSLAAATLKTWGVSLPGWAQGIQGMKGPGTGMPGWGLLGMWAFMTPFMIIAVVVLWIWLSSIIGRQVVTLRTTADEKGNDLTIFTGIGSLGWTKRLTTRGIRSVVIAKSRTTRVNNRPVDEIVIRGEKNTSFGTMLSADRRRWMAAALRQELLSKGMTAGEREAGENLYRNIV